MLEKELMQVAIRHATDSPSDSHPLVTLAVAWSTHSLKTYEGELLRAALGVSAAIMDLCNTLELVNPDIFQHDIECADTADKPNEGG